MKNALILTENQTHFLQENRQDPITGDSFDIGDEFVICAECKSAFLKDSWEYMNLKHCGQYKTLKNFPFPSYLFLTKAILRNFEQADKHARVFAYLVDCLIGVALGFLITISMSYFIAVYETFYYAVGTFIFYMLFKDILLKNKSFGKYIFGIYFINKKENKKNVYLPCLFRNIIYWITSAIVTYLLFKKTVFIGIDALIYNFYFLCILHVFYFLMMLLQNSLIDTFLRIELVQQKNKYK